MRTFEGNFNGENIKVGIVCGRFNEFITSKLLGGAKDALVRHGVNDENIDSIITQINNKKTWGEGISLPMDYRRNRLIKSVKQFFQRGFKRI